jgi:hypothetical protein
MHLRHLYRLSNGGLRDKSIINYNKYFSVHLAIVCKEVIV